MAKIIDFTAEIVRRFTAWAKEYVIIPDDGIGQDGCLLFTDEVIAFLIENGVFTEEDMRAELNKKKIPLNEYYFEKARKILKTT